MLSVLLCVRANYSQGCNLITGGDQTSVSWYQIRLVIFKFVSWYSNSSRGIQIRLVVGKFVLVVIKFACRLRLTALDSIVGNCC